MSIVSPEWYSLNLRCSANRTIPNVIYSDGDSFSSSSSFSFFLPLTLTKKTEVVFLDSSTCWSRVFTVEERKEIWWLLARSLSFLDGFLGEAIPESPKVVGTAVTVETFPGFDYSRRSKLLEFFNLWHRVWQETKRPFASVTCPVVRSLRDSKLDATAVTMNLVGGDGWRFRLGLWSSFISSTLFGFYA